MNKRKQLVDLIQQIIIPYWAELLADHLIKNDVTIQVHGNWGKPFKVDAYHIGHRCSECGYYGVPCWDYCPNCGARMDGDSR